jgi:hypothetical protein
MHSFQWFGIGQILYKTIDFFDKTHAKNLT